MLILASSIFSAEFGLMIFFTTTQYFDSRLETTSTAHNWHTVLKLLDLAPEGSLA